MSKPIYICNRDSVTFYLNGSPKIISKTHANYEKLILALERGANNDELERLTRDVRQTIADTLDGLLKIENGQLYFDGAPIHNSLSTRIISLMRDGYDVAPMSNFLRNLLDNPSKTAVDELYLFMENCNLPITEDGHFIAYKMVNSDFTDIYTGTMDNSVGAVVKMRRNAVDDQRENTCSEGLHFASLEYVINGNYGSKSYGHNLVALKINPKNVVSIPSDYNNSKGRACEYTVIKQLDWDELLPVNGVGFSFIDDTEDDEPETDDSAESFELTPNSGTVAWTDDEYRTVKRLLAEPDATVTGVSRETAKVLSRQMSRRQVARVRDGEIAKHVKL